MYGNHEITSTGLVDTNGFDEVHSSLGAEGDLIHRLAAFAGRRPGFR